MRTGTIHWPLTPRLGISEPTISKETMESFIPAIPTLQITLSACTWREQVIPTKPALE